MSKSMSNKERDDLEWTAQRSKETCNRNNSLNSCLIYKSGRKRKGGYRQSRGIDGTITTNSHESSRGNGGPTHGV